MKIRKNIVLDAINAEFIKDYASLKGGSMSSYINAMITNLRLSDKPPAHMDLYKRVIGDDGDVTTGKNELLEATQ